MKDDNFLSEENYKRLRMVVKELQSYSWIAAGLLINIYVGGLIGFYYFATGSAKFHTYLWSYFIFLLGGIRIGSGAHRLFAHRSFKATRSFKIFLLFCQCFSGQYSMLFWAKKHRVHHKFSDTEKDPLNSTRGFWFSHVFWVLKFTPECQRELDRMDVTDMTSDSDVMFQQRHIALLNLIFCVTLPTIVPALCWHESLWVAFFMNELHWLLNYIQMSAGASFVHMYGSKPYDKTITARDNFLINFLLYGEGYHNFHHVFPWEYRASEFGELRHLNLSTVLLDICARFGLVYDRKIASQQLIEMRMARTGDGSSISKSAEERKSHRDYGDIDLDTDDRPELHGYVREKEN